MTRVLIVDDNSENLYLLRALLEGNGYEVVEARNGEEALSACRQNRFDLAVSDLMMPVMDGFTLLRRWRADESLKSIPFIVYTATYTEPKDERLVMALGASAFILKPAEPEPFMAQVRDILLREEHGELPLPETPVDDSHLIQEYNEILVRKLEKKNRELQQTNLKLHDEVNERKTAEAKLASAQRRIQNLIESIDGIVYEADPETLQFSFVSPQAGKLLGFPLEDWTREGFFLERIHPEDADAVLQHRREQSAARKNHSYECRLKAADGSDVWIRDLISFVETPDALPQLRGLIVDVTDHKRIEEDLRLRDRAIQALSQGILIIDAAKPDFPVVYASAGFERMTGYRPSETIGKSFLSLQSDSADPDSLTVLRESLAQGRAGAVEILNLRKNGQEFWSQTAVSPILAPDGKLSHFVAVLNDVTARRKLEDQLRQSQKMDAIGRLAGGVAHDFNNLLTIITGYINLLLARDDWNTSDHESIVAVKEAADRASELTRQLLGFSRQTMLEPRIVDLNEVVANTGKMLKRLIGEDIHFSTSLATHLGRVKVDPGQLDQVLMNLAVNARDAMPNGGSLTIETANVELSREYAAAHPDSRPGPHVMLAVSDTGVGMSPSVMDRVFEPFFTTKEVGKGTGLGLAMVFGIVRQSEGSIHVYSEPGHGTTFKIYFPTVQEQNPLVEPAAPQLDLHGTETILIVEDEDAVRKLTVRCLSEYGYHILTARDGADALQTAEALPGPIHLVLSDVVMPRMGGPEFVAQLRTTLPDVRVLFMSGYTDDVVVRHGLLEANVSFIQKPFTPRGLVEKVRQVLDA